MGLAPSTESPLPELRSFSDQRHSLGYINEKLVEVRLLKKGFVILCRRTKIRGVEIDLLVYNPQKHNYAVIEVKSVIRSHWERSYLSESQKKRLQRACRHLLLLGVQPLSFAIALVDEDKNITFVTLEY